MDCFGLVFRIDGENQEAETDDERIIGKLRGNSHFDEVDAEDNESGSGQDVTDPVCDVNKLTRDGLQAYAKHHYDVDIPIANKSGMLETVTDLITRNS